MDYANHWGLIRDFMIHTKSKNNTAAKAEIRVIKKGEISRIEQPLSVNKQSKKQSARQLVATVMNWVSDFETHKLEETRAAMERFQHM